MRASGLLVPFVPRHVRVDQCIIQKHALYSFCLSFSGRWKCIIIIREEYVRGEAMLDSSCMSGDDEMHGNPIRRSDYFFMDPPEGLETAIGGFFGPLE
jgi:hypothetical protein